MDIVLVADARPLEKDMRLERVPLQAAFEERGIRVRLGASDNPKLDWPRTGACVLRTPSNYHRRRDASSRRRGTCRGSSTPPELVTWNSRRSYLHALEERDSHRPHRVPLGRDLARRAVQAPRLERGHSEARRLGRLVLARERFVPVQVAQAFLKESLGKMQAIVQPYLKSIDGSGERSRVYFGSELARREAPPAALERAAWRRRHRLPADERPFADAVLAAVPEPMLYARVDIARDDAGTLRLIELEVIEPSFFLDMVPEAAGRLADAVLAVTRSSGQGRDRPRTPLGRQARRRVGLGAWFSGTAAPAYCPAPAARR